MAVPFDSDAISTMSRPELIASLRRLRDDGHTICKLNAKTEQLRAALQEFSTDGGRYGSTNKISEQSNEADAGEISTLPAKAAATEAKKPVANLPDCGSITPTHGSSNTRSICLRGFGAVYICAFVSYWLQFPGCFGHNGLMPIDSFWTRVSGDPRFSSATDAPLIVQFPTPLPPQSVALPAMGAGWARALRQWAQFPCLLWLLGDDMDVDVAMEGTAILGGLCGVLAVVGFHHASVFLVAFVCYLSLFVTGQTFLGFQWDIFLLETGASLVLYAPWYAHMSTAAAP